MKANELVVGKKYWCGWASRSAWFVRFETHTWCGKTEKIAVFRDGYRGLMFDKFPWFLM